MESRTQVELQVTDNAYHASYGQSDHLKLEKVRQEMEYINTIGKRFVAAIDRFHVHRALLFALQDLYSFSACCILLFDETPQLFIIPCQPLSASFIQEMVQRIVSAAQVVDFPPLDIQHLIATAYMDAPDEVAQYRTQEAMECTEVGSVLNIPLTVENRIIGLLCLFDELVGTFDSEMLRLTTMIADYAAVALDNVRLRERENALWRRAELERQRLELILRSMAEGLLITDEKGMVISLNQSAWQLFNLARVDIARNQSFYLADIAEDRAWLLHLSQMIEWAPNWQTNTNHASTVGDKDDIVPLTLSVSVAPLHDASQSTHRPTGVVAVLNDVTSNKQVERLKDEFVSVDSHELRTPLPSIKSYTLNLIRRIERRLRKAHVAQETQSASMDGQESPESYDLHTLRIIQSQTDHLERLVNDLLDLSQVQSGQLILHYDTFNLAELLANCVHSAQAGSEQHTILLDIQTPESAVIADRERIAQVIGNMLDNAIKYSPHGGQVIVNLERTEEGYRVTIKDEGIGITPEQLDHIFERFYRVRNTTSRQYAGVGLGLYVSKAIIDSHGGTIGVFNNSPIGATFYFTLPFKPVSKPLQLSESL